MFANKKLLELMDSPSYKATKAINLFEFPPLKKSGFSEKLKKCINQDEIMTFEIQYESIWGEKSWFRVHINTNRENKRVIGANIVIDDISKEKLREEVLKDKVNRDALTQAYNRHALETVLDERLQQAAKSRMTGCIALLDIDDFKNVNDTYGHTVGDRILKFLSLRIKKELRKEDILIRTGGDEFLIYLHDVVDETNAEHTIKRIFNKISARYRLKDAFDERKFSIFVGCSLGAVFFPKHGKDVEKLMAKADEALYKAKADGKAGYVIEN
jgi:diguanylate cyclase (GGDEF)-like protein